MEIVEERGSNALFYRVARDVRPRRIEEQPVAVAVGLKYDFGEVFDDGSMLLFAFLELLGSNSAVVRERDCRCRRTE